MVVLCMTAHAPHQLWKKLESSSHLFDQWYLGQLHRICGADRPEAVLHKEGEPLYTWQAGDGHLRKREDGNGDN